MDFNILSKWETWGFSYTNLPSSWFLGFPWFVLVFIFLSKLNLDSMDSIDSDKKNTEKPHMIYLQQNLLIKLLHIQIPLSPPSVSVYSLPVPHPLSSSSGQSVSWLPISPCLFLSPLQIASGGDLSLGWTFPGHRWIETEGFNYLSDVTSYSKVE